MTWVQMCTLNQHPLTYFFAGNNMPVRSLSLILNSAADVTDCPSSATQTLWCVNKAEA